MISGLEVPQLALEVGEPLPLMDGLQPVIKLRIIEESEKPESVGYDSHGENSEEDEEGEDEDLSHDEEKLSNPNVFYLPPGYDQDVDMEDVGAGVDDLI